MKERKEGSARKRQIFGVVIATIAVIGIIIVLVVSGTFQKKQDMAPGLNYGEFAR